MDEREKGKSFDYEAHERLKKELEEAEGAKVLDADATDANREKSGYGEEWDDPIAGGPLPPFWKPEQPGEQRIGMLMAVRKTKAFEDHQGMALEVSLVKNEGKISVPVSAALARVEWAYFVGRVFLFVFKGWLDLEGGFKMRDIEVRPRKSEEIPL